MLPLNQLRIGLASDHAGYALKLKVIEHLFHAGATVHDFGCYSTDSCDYPDFAHPLAAAVENGQEDFGITICSTGNGICMTANKHQGIRAALCWDVPIARLARQHNNANILGLPANFVSEELALEMVDVFFATDFEGGRHERRINKIPLK